MIERESYVSGAAEFCVVVLCCVSGCVRELKALSAEDGRRPPNIVVFVADDMGFNDIGYHNDAIDTPVLDRLAGEGARLERFYVYPTCSPTRAAFLTGRNPSRFDILGPIGGRSEQALPIGTPTLSLESNDPNPFDVRTTIRYAIPHAGPVTLVVYDTAGRRVRTLVDDWRPAGQHAVEWDGTGTGDRLAASGVYFCRLENGGLAETRRVVLIRN